MKKLLLLITFAFTPFFAVAQQEDAWVYFTDKENVANSIANPITILTQRAIDRKANHNVAIDARDVPVNETYITQVKNAIGVTVMAKSKWLNAVHVRGTQTNINNLSTLPSVDRIDFANKNLNTALNINTNDDKFSIENVEVTFNYGNTENQVDMINVDELHEMDFTGEGILIAVMDGGFPNVNTMGAFQRLRNAGDLLGGFDFVHRTTDIYATSNTSHGTRVLSTMAGYIENQFVGTAPDASYYLFITEDGPNENPVEESYWVEAVERADSLGVDIINTSLGYSNFDNANYNYARSDFDGSTTYITRGANIAFEKGLLLVTSAGNSGATGISAPADSQGVLSIGAVDSNGNYASFSSQGSSVQPVQKPDVVARGSGSFVIESSNAIVQNNGTSFSSPIMAGGIACLWQALPDVTNGELMQLVRESASQYNSPDNFLGYGIPDLGSILNSTLSQGDEIEQDKFTIFPNPTSGRLNITFPTDTDEADFLLFDVLGKQIFKTTILRSNNAVDLGDLPRGIYIARMQTSNQSNTYKLIKR
ncbi:T9SS C-terminal target domain-containing protein [Flavobacteriaceae bacterium AU392]|nr:T9SS C-terminal target domain-containing protein [Flavobacteriaceae bacterium]RKM83715.1 T9SS C-terminal target domain-containing protein [Flavobacteriaceae bacterium AU392]